MKTVSFTAKEISWILVFLFAALFPPLEIFFFPPVARLSNVERTFDCCKWSPERQTLSAANVSIRPSSGFCGWVVG